MKTRNKALLMALCAVLLVVASVMGTVAYLTDVESVKNTFTVGKVVITLDETVVDVNGVPVKDAEGKTTSTDSGNAYHLMPNGNYVKDPTVHVKNDSDNSWIFVKVVNGISAIEDSTNTIAAQIKTNGWEQLKDADGNDVAGVYYKAWTKPANAAADTYTDLPVFGTFKIANTVKGEDLAQYASATIEVTAYAIQQAGFETNVAGAWNEVKNLSETPATPNA